VSGPLPPAVHTAPCSRATLTPRIPRTPVSATPDSQCTPRSRKAAAARSSQSASCCSRRRSLRARAIHSAHAGRPLVNETARRPCRHGALISRPLTPPQRTPPRPRLLALEAAKARSPTPLAATARRIPLPGSLLVPRQQADTRCA
jgi:hypothetical protein